MDLGDSLALDLLITDTPETMTVVTAGVSRTVTNCLRRAISRAEVQASGGLFTAQDSVVYLPVASSQWSDTVTAPVEGSKVTDSASVVWYVVPQGVRAIVLDTLYRCVVARERTPWTAPTVSSATGTVGVGADQFTAVNGDSVTFSPGYALAMQSDGEVERADADDNLKNAVGLATVGVAVGARETITTSGTFELASWSSVTGSATLTPGAVYYLSTTAGQLTTTPPSTAGNVVQRVGVAVSTLKLKIEVEEPVLLS